MTLRYHLHVLLHNPDGDNRASLRFNRALALLIILNAVAVALETDVAFAAGHETAFAILEQFSLADLLALGTFFLRLLRLVRLLRVANVRAFSYTLDRLRTSVRDRRDLLVVSGLLMFIALFISASLVYYFEHGAQPKVFASIPSSLWWAVVTLTTTGYGDMAPVTPGGRLWAAFALIFGVGIFALPGAILTSAVISASEKRVDVCPHCGRPLQ